MRFSNAREYGSLIDELGVKPLLRTIFADAHSLVSQFGDNRFDIVHAQNTVDHMRDPWLAIRQIIRVARPGGVVYLRHEENEATRNSFTNLHQWNFSLEDATGHFVIENKERQKLDVTELTSAWGQSQTYREARRVVFEFTKNRTPSQLA